MRNDIFSGEVEEGVGVKVVFRVGQRRRMKSQRAHQKLYVVVLCGFP